MGTRSNEKVVCAAIWLDDGRKYNMQPKNIQSGVVVCGHRHPHCKAILMAWLYPNWQTDDLQTILKNEVNNKEVQGFLTSENRFVDRQEGASIHVSNGGILHYNSNTLYSEDLY